MICLRCGRYKNVDSEGEREGLGPCVCPQTRARDLNRYGAPPPGVPTGPRPTLSQLDGDVSEQEDDHGERA